MTPRFGLCVFDLDGTLVAHDEPIWKTLHTRLGSDPVARKDALRRGLAGELGYADWVAHDVRLLREAGATRAKVEALVDELSLAPGAEALLEALAAAGTRVVVLSGGIDAIAERHLPAHLVMRVHANRLHFDPDGQLVGATPTPWDRAEKATAIALLAAELGVERERIAFVGNGANDVWAARAAGFAIAWGDAPPELVAASHVFEPGPDLNTLTRWLL